MGGERGDDRALRVRQLGDRREGGASALPGGPARDDLLVGQIHAHPGATAEESRLGGGA